MGEGECEATISDFRNELGALLGVAAVAQKTAAENHGGEKRLQRQSPAERFHRDHRLDRTACRAAIALAKGQSEQPERGILPPQLAAPALRAVPVALALL